MDGRLVLISPYDPRAGFSVGNAMRRNKLIYAIADAGLVVNAAYKKGGTWAGAVEQLDKLRFVTIYARADGEDSKGLEALLRKGAYKWPNPKTSGEFRQALSDAAPKFEAEAYWKKIFAPATEEAIESSDNYIGKEITPSPSNRALADVGEATPADVLLAKVEELLLLVDIPTTESAVAIHLNVSKSQAREWLNRLVREGKYSRSVRPVRYHRSRLC